MFCFSSSLLATEGSDQASSKSTTNTMYAPSSYNDTVVGETLSSISEKSRESYTQEDSVVDYEVSIATVRVGKGRAEKEKEKEGKSSGYAHRGKFEEEPVKRRGLMIFEKGEKGKKKTWMSVQSEEKKKLAE